MRKSETGDHDRRHQQNRASGPESPSFEELTHDSSSFGRNGFAGLLWGYRPGFADQQRRRGKSQRDDDGPNGRADADTVTVETVYRNNFRFCCVLSCRPTPEPTQTRVRKDIASSVCFSSPVQGGANCCRNRLILRQACRLTELDHSVETLLKDVV